MNGGCYGISIVVPTWNGARRLPRLLDSLAAQSADHGSFEVIFILNGSLDDSESVIRRFSDCNPQIETRIYFLADAGAGIARNIGLAVARRSHITFIDDDDYIQSAFIESSLQLCEGRKIGLLPIVNERDGVLSDTTSLAARIRSLRGTTLPLTSVPWTLGFNACKIVPTEIARRYRYVPSLKSGEDVAYFANLLRHPGLEIAVSSSGRESGYVRVHRENSISRRDDSFSFCVEERLDVIKALRSIPLRGAYADARESLVQAQFGFVERYLRLRPDDIERAIDCACERGIRGLSWRAAWGNAKAKRLVISFCFPPYADPAANVAAKRLAARREIVDVISADMSAVRSTDETSEEIANPWINSHTEISVYPAFSAWPLISEFASAALREALSHEYESVYSRAMWSGSHVAAALFKIRRPSVHWEAEFSDPMRFDATGAVREGEITPGGVTDELRQIISSSPWPRLPVTSHFELTEGATLIAADEVIFSNMNQQALVLAQYPESFRRMVEEKASVVPQPTPSRELYRFCEVDIELVPGVVNVAYFGNFYHNRGLGTLLEAVAELPAHGGREFALHIFTGNASHIYEAESDAVGGMRVVVHRPLPYLEFLNATSKFDVLLVVDALTSGTVFEVNPFLPSKYSDYVGSGAPVWAMYEEGSPLSLVEATYRSRLDNVEETTRVLSQLQDGLRRNLGLANESLSNSQKGY